MIDRAVVASMCVGTGVRTAAWVERILDTAENTAADITGRIARPEFNDVWRVFLVDALTAVQLAAAAVDLDHDLDVGALAAPLVRQLAEVAAMSAADDARSLVVGDAPSAIY